MELKGSVTDIIFRNEENGYSVIELACKGRLLTAVGKFPPVTEGQELELEGRYVINRQFGEQFAVDKVAIAQPTSEESIIRYLSGGLFKGVGEVTARAIVEKFGTDTLKVIENDPSALAQIKGISLKKAMEINTSFHYLRDMQDAILFLQDLDIGLNVAIKIYKIYGADTQRTVRNNPYKLVEDVDGVGFLTADKIAAGLGIREDSRFRITAAVVHTLKEATNKNGHTYLPREMLVSECRKLLHLQRLDAEDVIGDVIDDMEVAGKLVCIKTPEHTAVILSGFYISERAIASSIVRLAHMQMPLEISAMADIEEYERINRITLHENQKKAVEGCLKHGISVVTGGPGTGKTTIIKCIISILRSRKKKVALCAPTGRAAKRLTEATGEEAKTIHRMLDLAFGEGGMFTFDENTKQDADVVIVDEVSMCDEYVFSALLSSLKGGASLVMVGDKDQLPSVGAGNVLADVIKSRVVPVYYLTQIYRQDEHSLIVSNAHAINSGKMPVFDNKSRDFFFSSCEDPEEILSTVIDMVTKRLPGFTGMDANRIQVLCPMKKGIAGVENMNEKLQETLNPPEKGKPEIRVGLNVLRLHDKIIHTMNNYDLEWTDEEGGAGSGVYNGDIGYITAVNVTEPSLTVKFEDGKTAKYTQGSLDQIKPAYAVSVHKSQGSEFPVVVIALPKGNYMIMTRNLLYTAVTRARNVVVLVGAKQTIANMVSNTYTTRRYSLLADFIEESEKRKRG